MLKGCPLSGRTMSYRVEVLEKILFGTNKTSTRQHESHTDNNHAKR